MSQENKHEKLDPEQEQTVLDQEEAQKAQPEPTGEPKPEEIGRASCRERVF